MTAKIINGKEIAKEIQKQVTNEITQLKNKYNTQPLIATITIGKDPSSELYLRLRNNACKEVGIKTKHLEFLEKTSEKEIINTIQKINKDSDIHGMLIQYPIPKHISPEKLMNTIDPKKDVEGFHPYNMGQTLLGNEHIVPCTPSAVLTILQHEKTILKGKDIVIVNHSNVVGRPLTALLLKRDATIAVCHVFTKNLNQYTYNADILITAAGVPRLITKNHVKEDAFVIDVGIIPTKDGVCGDVYFEEVKEKAGKLTPVPGGVGPVTIACSLQNMVKTFRNCID